MKRTICLILCLCLMLAVLPVGALAADKPVYLALGDSISTGYGLNDPDSESFTARIAGVLDFELVNRAVDGNTAAGIRAQVESGALDDEIASAELITITCGGNDMLNLVYAKAAESYNASYDPDITAGDVVGILESAGADERFMNLARACMGALNGNEEAGIPPFVQSEEFFAAVSAYAGNVDTIMNTIDQINPNATVIITTQYNPYKHFTGMFASVAQQIDLGIQQLNAPITHPDSGHTYADVYAAFNQTGDPLTNATENPLNLDFHPNIGGHEYIAATILEKWYQLTRFTDVKKGEFYYEPVLWAVEKGITNGISDTLFGTNNNCSRAQVVTFLWRACGSPEPTNTTCNFTDVVEGSFYYKAVLWAVEEGITNGISDTLFGTNDNCSRAQVVTFLWRAVERPGYTTAKNSFTDVKQGDFYYDAVLWAVEKGVTNGVSGTLFGTNTNCSRAQVVTFLHRTFVTK